jgi:hypothetical protein
VTDAFYERLDEDRYRSTGHTTGPWDPGAQHAGPPSALLGGAMQALVEQPFARLTFEILRPVPITELTVTTRVPRPGRRIALVEGELHDDDGPCLLARAWAIRQDEIGIPVTSSPEAPLAGPELGREVDFFEVEADRGWHTAMELRFLSGGGFSVPGPAQVWLRTRIPVVLGEPVSPLQRVLVAADAGNGASAAADPRAWLFVNTELTVHLHRHPAGEWVGLDAVSVYEPHGVGLATTVLHDGRGPIGRGAQALYLGPSPTRESGRG